MHGATIKILILYFSDTLLHTYWLFDDKE